MSTGIQLIGDEIHFDGELVAIMTDNAAPTLRGRFTDLLDEVEETQEPKTLNDLERLAQESAKGGLLRMSDLARIVAQLKDPK